MRNWMPVLSIARAMSPPRASISRTIWPLASPPMAGLQLIAPIFDGSRLTSATRAPRRDAAHAASAPAWPPPITMMSKSVFIREESSPRKHGGLGEDKRKEPQMHADERGWKEKLLTL